MRWFCVLTLMAVLLAGCAETATYSTPEEAVQARFGSDVQLLATWDMPWGKLGVASDSVTDLASYELRKLDGGWFVGSGGKATPWRLSCLTVSGGGMESASKREPSYGEAHGRITDPRVIRVAITAPEVGTVDAQITGDVYLLVKQGVTNIHTTHIAGYDSTGQIVCEESMNWPKP